MRKSLEMVNPNKARLNRDCRNAHEHRLTSSRHPSPVHQHLLALLLLRFLEHLLNDLLLLDEECANNAVLDAVGAS
jgi:hypothetical protein